MTGSVGDPVLLRHNSWAINNELITFWIESGSCLHLWGIVSISKLSETEAAHHVKTIEFLQEICVLFGTQSHETSSKEIILHSEFCSH
jgi:hypothetical protein